MASDHSAPGAALLRPLLRAAAVGGFLVVGWLLGSSTGMAAVPAPVVADSGLTGDESPWEAGEDQLSETGRPAADTTDAADAATDPARPAGSSGEQKAAVEHVRQLVAGTASPATGPTSPAATDESAASLSDEPGEPRERRGGTAPAEELAAAAEPVTSLAEPVTSLAEPVTSLAEPVTSLAEPVTSLAEPVVELAGGVAATPRRPAQVETVPASGPTAARPAATPRQDAGAVADPSPAEAAPQPRSGPADGVPADMRTAADAAGNTSSVSSTVDDVSQRGEPALPCSPGGSSGVSSGGCALSASTGALTPPAEPARSLLRRPVGVAPGLLAQRPSTSPD